MKIRRYTCRTVANMLPLHVGRDLDPRHVAAVDAHLKECLNCFREFRELAAMRGRLGVLAENPLPPGILDGFTEEVMARLAVGEPGPAAEAPRPSTAWYALPRLTAAAAILLVCLAGWRLVHDGAAFSPDGTGGPAVVGDRAVGGVQTPSGHAAPALPQVGAPVRQPAVPVRMPGQGHAHSLRAPAHQHGSGQVLIILESGGTAPSAEDEEFIEVTREVGLGLNKVEGLRQDDPSRQPRKRQP